MQKIEFLSGDRIYLRPMELEDVDMFCKWFNDPEVRQYLSMVFPLSKLKEKEWVEKIQKDRDQVVLVIVVKSEDNPIGTVGLHRGDRTSRNAEFGIAIGEKSYWSQGYGTEGAKLMIDYGFGTLNLHRIYLRVFAFNERARRSYIKIGFREEGVFRDAVYRDGRYHDVLVMSILKSEWSG